MRRAYDNQEQTINRQSTYLAALSLARERRSFLIDLIAPPPVLRKTTTILGADSNQHPDFLYDFCLKSDAKISRTNFCKLVYRATQIA